MFRGIKTVTIRLLLTANVVAIIAMLAVGYSDRLQPTLHPTLSVSGLLFPGFIVLNLLFFPLWVFIKPKNVLVPLFGFIISYVPVRTYCPVNMPEDPPEGALKILSYNTWSFHEERDADGNVVASAADYIVECNADIACLQEAWMGNIRTKTIADHYPYVKSCIIDNANSIMVASRYPIVKVERIFYESQINGSAAFFLDIEGDTVVVVNTHFESNVFSLEDRQQISDFVNGRLKKGDVEADTRNLLEKLTRAARIRAPQADSVARYIEDHDQYPIILCGDFNTWPNSYTHHRMASLLTDCYVATGLGPGWTFNRNHIDVRIDNIMCSRHWEPFACRVDDDIVASDHFPVTCWLKKKRKEQKNAHFSP